MNSVHQKVLAYITFKDQLLIFSHPDFPEAGLQVPAGTLHPGERPEDGVMREAYEETGLKDLTLIRFLGESRREMLDFNQEQIHHRFYFHLACSKEPPQTWRHYETDPSDGSPGPIAFDFFWVPLHGGVPPLIADMDEQLPVLIQWIKNSRSNHFVDLSHIVEDGMITYKGLPGPVICDFWSREYSRQFYTSGTEFQIGKIEMVANTGTYVDSPFHRFEDGKDLSELPLSSLANLDGVVVRLRSEGRAIDYQYFQGLDVRGKAVLVHTSWDARWGTESYFEGHPYLTGDAAQFLVEAGAALVGIDSLNIDDTADGSRPVHTTLLKAEIPIVEHMRGLEQLPDQYFRFFAVPVKVKGFGTFPVRAFAILA